MAYRIVAEIEIPASKIHANPNNPRYQVGDVGSLKKSIEQYGLLQSVLVRHAPDHGNYILEAGERRWTACRFINPNYRIAARIVTLPDDISPEEHALIIGLVENDHRENLTPMDRAKAYGRLRDEFHKTQQQTAAILGVTGSTVSRYLGLLELSEKSQRRVAGLEGKPLSVEDALSAVKRHRAKVRKDQGHDPIDVGWEPPNFTSRHFLANKAKKMCSGLEHGVRRKANDSGACEHCWERVIRDDEAKVQQLAFREQGFDVPFQSPVMAAAGNAIGRNGKQ